jgi:hypothetical protein
MQRVGTFLGPVGLFFISLGYTVAASVARVFVTLEAVCTSHCPVFKVEGFRFHHMYYGLLLVAISAGVMLIAADARTRWDSGLVMGIGFGLIADEVGLLVLRQPYWSLISFGIVAGGALFLYSATLIASLRAGLRDFHFVDRYQFLALLGILFGFTGFLFFDRPVRMVVEAAAISSWLVSIVLMTKYGRKHFFLLRHAPLDYGPRAR